ncbi:MAG: hypothetical protein FJ340_08130 [Sphingomonadales bacterium]|nr:hypothetical protein [Sphingomonadales bacterium]
MRLLPLPATFLLIVFALTSYTLPAQEPLPNFQVRDIGSGRIVISWINQYPYTAQITIQRSFDSTRGYKSILTVPDPTALQNGFADTKAVNDHMFYRLYILLDKGRYFFTTPQRPVRQAMATDLIGPNLSSGSATNQPVSNNMGSPVKPTTRTPSDNVVSESPKEDKIDNTDPPLSFPVKKVDPIVINLDRSKMGDSAKTPFAVTLQNDPDAYAPSLYVYAQPDGNVRIEVPNKKRYPYYRIRFYEPDKQFLFELKQLPAATFQLDKTNFLHSGWFLYELYEEARLIERHKVFLEKDF